MNRDAVKGIKRMQHCPPRVTRCKRFVSIGRAKKDIYKNTISSWLREVITTAYDSDRNSSVSRAHDITVIAPSVAYRRNHSLLQVLKLGVWKCQTTFTFFHQRFSLQGFLLTSTAPSGSRSIPIKDARVTAEADLKWKKRTSQVQVRPQI